MTKNYFYPLAAAFLLSFIGIFYKFLAIEYGISFNLNLFISCVFAMITFFIISITKYKTLDCFKISKRQFISAFIFCGFLCIFLTQAFGLYSLKHIGAGVQKTIAFTDSLFLIVLNLIFFRSKIQKKHLVAGLIILCGLFLMINKGNPIEGGNFMLGASLAFVTPISIALFYIGVENYKTEETKLPVFYFYAFMSATFFSFLGTLFAGDFVRASEFVLNFELMFYLLIGAILFFVIQNILYLIAIKKNGAITTAIFLTLTPVFAIIESYFMFGEQLGTQQFIGVFLIVCASVLNAVDLKKKIK